LVRVSGRDGATFARSAGCARERARDTGRGAVAVRSRQRGGGSRAPAASRLLESRRRYLEPAAEAIAAITWSSEKLAGFMRGGNSLKLVSHLATKACAGTRR
jgi:hypothetical protein